MHVGGAQHDQLVCRSSKPKRNASAVVVKDITELMRTSAAMDSQLELNSFISERLPRVHPSVEVNSRVTVRSKKSSQTQAIERLSSRRSVARPSLHPMPLADPTAPSTRPYIAPTAPSSHGVLVGERAWLCQTHVQCLVYCSAETLGSSVMRGWEKRGVFGVIKAEKEW